MPKGHEKLANRIANILIKLNEGDALSAKELSDEFGVTTRTIQNDFKRLGDLVSRSKNKYKLSYGNNINIATLKEFLDISGVSNLYPALDMKFFLSIVESKSKR